MALVAGFLFFSVAFGFVLRLCRYSVAFDEFVYLIGWILVTFYISAVLAKWALAALPKQKVTPGGKAVLITGCDTGFGHSLAQRLCSSGYTVFAGCLDEDGDGAKKLKEICSPNNLHIIPMDVTKYDQVHAAVKDVETRLGEKELWAVVNNAGVAIFSELEWCSMSIIEHMFNVNVMGAMRVTKAFLPLLRKSKGRVIIVASVAGHITYPGFLTYSMTKHALVSFADGLRREMRKWNIAVSTIEPAMYRTRISMSDVLTGALDNSWEKTPEQIKEAYGFPYYSDFRNRMQKIALQARPYLDEVVQCMEKAVTEVYPRITYRCSGPADKVRVWVMSLLPTALLDALICYVIQPSSRQLSGCGKNA